MAEKGVYLGDLRGEERRRRRHDGGPDHLASRHQGSDPLSPTSPLRRIHNPTQHKTDRLQPTHPRFVTVIIRFILVILCHLIPPLRSEPHLDSPNPS